jgi:type II secretory pathway component PulK
MSRISTLLLVVSLLCLVFAALGALFGLSQPSDVERRFLWLAGWYAIGGCALFLLRLAFFVLPARIRRLTSAAASPLAAAAPAEGPAGDAPLAKRGSALVLVLVLLGLIAGMVIQAQVRARWALRESRRLSGRLDLQRAAGDAVRAALQRLADDEDLRSDSTNEAWAASENAVNPLGVATLVRVTDEDRFFDLNNLAVQTGPGTRKPDDILGDLLAQCGVFSATQPAGALLDWIDADDAGLAESRFYAAKERPYRCSNRLLFDWPELLLVEGWTREMFLPGKRQGRTGLFEASPADCLTLLPVARTLPIPVNVNTAPPEVLLAIVGMENDAVAGSILALRAVRPIRSVESLAVLGDPLLSSRVGPYLDVRSHFFRIRARAYKDEESQSLEVLVRRQASGQVGVLQWTCL